MKTCKYCGNLTPCWCLYRLSPRGLAYWNAALANWRHWNFLGRPDNWMGKLYLAVDIGCPPIDAQTEDFGAFDGIARGIV